MPSNLRNIRWKDPDSGAGPLHPIVWGDRVFRYQRDKRGRRRRLSRSGFMVTAKSADDNEASSGRSTAWTKTRQEFSGNGRFHAGVRKARRHPKATHANCTWRQTGRTSWRFSARRDSTATISTANCAGRKILGLLESVPYNAPSLQWGFASSPILFDNMIVLQCDVKDQSLLSPHSRFRNGHRDMAHAPR